MYIKLMEIYTVVTVIVDSKYSTRLCGPWEIETNFVTNNLSLIDRIRKYLEKNPDQNVNLLLMYISNTYNYRLPGEKNERLEIFNILKNKLGNIKFNFMNLYLVCYSLVIDL